jgi:hypothetical protein
LFLTKRSPNGRRIAEDIGVKVRVVRQPQGTVQGVTLQSYHAGYVYDIAPALAEFLIAEGYAILEMRREEQRALAEPERRRVARTIIDEHRNGRRVR